MLLGAESEGNLGPKACGGMVYNVGRCNLAFENMYLLPQLVRSDRVTRLAFSLIRYSDMIWKSMISTERQKLQPRISLVYGGLPNQNLESRLCQESRTGSMESEMM